MKRASTLLALAAGACLLAAPALGVAMGESGAGGGGMPSDPNMATNAGSGGLPSYDPVEEYQRGQSDLQAGKYRAAVDDFQHVLSVTPDAGDAWLMLGMSKSGAGDERGAEKAYEKAVKLDDASIDAHRELALALIKLKQPDKASAELAALQAKATACAGQCPQAADLKAAIDAVNAAMSPTAAAPAAGAPAAANPTPNSLSLASPQADDGAYVRAVSLINERRWDDALASLSQAELAIGPHPDILTYEGYVWRHKGDWTRAEAYYNQALAIDPNHRGATEYYGELKVLKGDMAGARVMLAKLDQACTFGCAEAEELRRWIDHGGDPAS